MYSLAPYYPLICQVTVSHCFYRDVGLPGQQEAQQAATIQVDDGACQAGSARSMRDLSCVAAL